MSRSSDNAEAYADAKTSAGECEYRNQSDDDVDSETDTRTGEADAYTGNSKAAGE